MTVIILLKSSIVGFLFGTCLFFSIHEKFCKRLNCKYKIGSK